MSCKLCVLWVLCAANDIYHLLIFAVRWSATLNPNMYIFTSENTTRGIFLSYFLKQHAYPYCTSTIHYIARWILFLEGKAKWESCAFIFMFSIGESPMGTDDEMPCRLIAWNQYNHFLINSFLNSSLFVILFMKCFSHYIRSPPILIGTPVQLPVNTNCWSANHMTVTLCL